MTDEKILVTIHADEKYPFYNVDKAERLIGGTANASLGITRNYWELKTIDDVLKMDWLHFFNLPKDKYDWIQSVYHQLEEVNEYIENLQESDKVNGLNGGMKND